MRPLLARERRAAGMVMEGTALEFLPWEAKAFDTLELPLDYVGLGIAEERLYPQFVPVLYKLSFKLKTVLRGCTGPASV